MSHQTNIEWADSTFNPWIGCTKVSPACDNCYAENLMATRMGRVQWGPGKPRSRTSAGNWRKPIAWNNNPYCVCDGCGHRGAKGIEHEDGSLRCEACAAETLREVRRRVFCASLADWLDNEVPTEWLVDLLDLIRQTPNLDWLLLTKRIGNFDARLSAASNTYRSQVLTSWIDDWLAGHAPDNVWLGATVINQAEYDRDLLKLLRAPAQVRFVSIEPMLGRINLSLVGTLPGDDFPGYQLVASCLHWVIAGGESGQHARPMHPAWPRALRDQCQQTGVPFLFKQWGEWMPYGSIDGAGNQNSVDCGEKPGLWHPWDDDAVGSVRLGKKLAGRTLDGETYTQFPVAAG